MKFIYVFTKDAADKLAANGYKLLKADEKNSVFTFENKSEIKFSLDVSYIFSDTLTF
jgi:hypothetical protein